MYFLRIFSAIALSVLFSCTKTAIMNVQVLEPGGIKVPLYIKTIAFVDRSLPPDPKSKNILGIFTGEGVVRDRQAAQQVLAGVMDQLRTVPRYQMVLSGTPLIGSQTGGIFPPPLDSFVINKICEEYHADAVIAMEEFSANSSISTAEKIVDVAENVAKNGIGGIFQNVAGSVANQYSATQTAVIKIGFRLYDRHSNAIGDQFAFTWSNHWTSDPSNTVNGAITGVMHDNIAIGKAAYAAGVSYGRRVAPSWLWVNRLYYRRSKNYEMGVAARMAITGDWQHAIEVWKECEQKLGRLKAGRAAFNLALAYEISGDLDQAQQWCQKSYVVYKNKNARSYSQILRQRNYEIQQLHQQTGQ